MRRTFEPGIPRVFERRSRRRRCRCHAAIRPARVASRRVAFVLNYESIASIWNYVMQTRDSLHKRPWVAAIVISLLPMMCGAQSVALTRDILSNRDIVTLANAGFTEAFILQTIATSPAKFELTADALADLAKNGITEDIVRAMRNSANKSKSAAVRQETAALSEQDAGTGAQASNRVFVEANPDSWSRSQSHPQYVEFVRTFGQVCPALVVTNRREMATFVVAWDRESGTEMVVFNRSGDMVYETSAPLLADAIRAFCVAAQKKGPGLQ